MKRNVDELKKALHRQKETDELLDEQIEKALHEHRRPNRELFLSAITAGLEIGFSVFLMAAVYTRLNGVIHDSFLDFLLALAYPLGFIFVVIGRSELFTEHTTIAILPVLSGDATIKRLLGLWGVIYAGNLLGGYLFGAIMAVVPVKLGAVTTEALCDLAIHLIDHPWYIIGGSGVLAGWLMGLLSWLVTASQDTLSRILIIALITSVIGIGGLHHSIVGSIEVFTGVISSPDLGISDYLKVQIWATLGNIIGGTVFVAFMKYSHIRSMKEE